MRPQSIEGGGGGAPTQGQRGAVKPLTQLAWSGSEAPRCWPGSPASLLRFAGGIGGGATRVELGGMIQLQNSPAGVFWRCVYGLGFFLARSIPASDSPACAGTGALRPCALTRSERGTEQLEELLKRWQLGLRRFPHQFKACVCVCNFSNVFLNSVLCFCRSIQPCSSQVDYSWNPPTLSGCLGNSLNCCLLGRFFRLLKVCLLWHFGGGVGKKKLG